VVEYLTGKRDFPNPTPAHHTQNPNFQELSKVLPNLLPYSRSGLCNRFPKVATTRLYRNFCAGPHRERGWSCFYTV
jgi:hypothetical protein